MINKIINKIFTFLLITIFCVSCTGNTAPLEYAPPADIVRRALELSLQIEYGNLSNHLHNKAPQIIIKKINIANIKSTINNNLPTYKLTGKYRVLFIDKKKQKKIVENKFELNLQREKKGQTWYLVMLKRHNIKEKYYRYKIQKM
ncbi:MAG: hypothetical protein IGQ45_05025 [Cyanobacterium sp. T60_A2020_053]|nr:hypothetical protein [Cyanobacterium sp. T60_A2020_053]